MDEELRDIESKLEQMAPVAMPDDMLARMEQAMDRWQESVPVEEKIIPFQVEAPEKNKLGVFSAWASAAAVALIAAASYVVFNQSEEPEAAFASVAQDQPVATLPSSVPAANLDKVIPASHPKFRTQVTNASDGMVTYDAQGRPFRVMEFSFEDEVIVRDRNGKLHKVKQPRVEYYAVPVEVH